MFPHTEATAQTMSKQMKRDQDSFQAWLFEPMKDTASKRDIWLWWEARRFIYNGMVVLGGLISFAAYCIFILASGHLSQGEDLIEPIAVIAAVTVGPVIWNCAYCLGPIVDIAAFTLTRKIFGPALLKLGMIFSLLLVGFPALYWAFEFSKTALCGTIGR